MSLISDNIDAAATVENAMFDGRIIVAEDQKINLDALQMNIKDVGIDSKCLYCNDGQKTLKVALEILEDALKMPSTDTVRPIAMMILDLQMPYKNGIQIVQEMQ